MKEIFAGLTLFFLATTVFLQRDVGVPPSQGIRAPESRPRGVEPAAPGEGSGMTWYWVWVAFEVLAMAILLILMVRAILTGPH